MHELSPSGERSIVIDERWGWHGVGVQRDELDAGVVLANLPKRGQRHSSSCHSLSGGTPQATLALLEAPCSAVARLTGQSRPSCACLEPSLLAVNQGVRRMPWSWCIWLVQMAASMPCLKESSSANPLSCQDPFSFGQPPPRTRPRPPRH
ncbi:uncharacterized protein BKA78DRAFT_140244 [Phyllosticta capitalensis]|uniref:uncharacterized protein n=1 Tax=Phyllosticta capitalensis TaxID=121624 RepID=UPI00313194DD